MKAIRRARPYAPVVPHAGNDRSCAHDVPRFRSLRCKRIENVNLAYKGDAQCQNKE